MRQKDSPDANIKEDYDRIGKWNENSHVLFEIAL